MRIDGVHPDVRTERGHDAGEHNRGAAVIRADLDDRSRLRCLGERAGEARDQQVGLGVLEPALDRAHTL